MNALPFVSGPCVLGLSSKNGAVIPQSALSNSDRKMASGNCL